MDVVNRVTDPTGTITYTVFDARGLTLSVWVGTADAGATDTDPTGGRSARRPPVRPTTCWKRRATSTTTARAAAMATSPRSIAYVNASTERDTLYGYDWRDRQLWAMVYDGAHYTYTYNTYDNLDEVTDVTRYYDESGEPGVTDNAPNSGDPIIGRSGAAYDDLGREYQTISYNEPGTIATITNTWYDGDGDTIMVLPGGTQEFTKTVYDGLGDAIDVYTGYDPESRTGPRSPTPRPAA